MYTLQALVVVALTACAIAAPPGVREAENDPIQSEPLNGKSIPDFLLPRYLRSAYVANDGLPRIPYPRPQTPSSDWLNKEIEHINEMQDLTPDLVPNNDEVPRWILQEPYKRIVYDAVGAYGTRSAVSAYFEYPMLYSKILSAASAIPRKHAKVLHQTINTEDRDQEDTDEDFYEDRKIFALTPLDDGYFEPTEKDIFAQNSPLGEMMEAGPHEGGGHEDEDLRRDIRQNPISRTKTLVNDDLNILRAGVGSESDSKDKPELYSVLGSEFATGTIYAVGIAAGVGTAIVLAILGFTFGWYALSKRAKDAADVDYPAYGVTGPTKDTSGDRKLAHSAQMYHYQHQKQQIIAMERTNVDHNNGSVSDPESEEENEEGDYTVYECPGFATTGDMEVKNPLFNEEPTPATPGKFAVVKPQPKE